MSHSAEKDTPYLGHGSLCEWDEDMARMFCHPEHKARLAAARKARRSVRRARIRRALRRVFPSEKKEEP